MEGLEDAQASSPSPELRRNSLELEGRSDHWRPTAGWNPGALKPPREEGVRPECPHGWGGATTKGMRRGRGRRERYGEERRLRPGLGGCPSRRDDQCSSQTDVALGKQGLEGGGRTPCWWAEGGKGVKTGKAIGPWEVKGREKRSCLRRAEMRHMVSSQGKESRWRGSSYRPGGTGRMRGCSRGWRQSAG